MSKSIDRIEFYEQLGKAKNRQEIDELIENIEDDELQIIIQDKLAQILEVNKNEDVKNIIKILEYAYLKYENDNK